MSDTTETRDEALDTGRTLYGPTDELLDTVEAGIRGSVGSIHDTGGLLVRAAAEDALAELRRRLRRSTPEEGVREAVYRDVIASVNLHAHLQHAGGPEECAAPVCRIRQNILHRVDPREAHSRLRDALDPEEE